MKNPFSFECWKCSAADGLFSVFCTQMSNLRAFALKTNTIRLNSVTNTVCGIGLVCTQQHVSQMRLSKFILQPNSLSEKLMFVCTWKLSLRAPSPSPNQSHWIGHLSVLRWEVTANLAAGKWLQSFIHGRKASANKGNRFDRTCFSGQTVSALMPHAIMPPPVSNRLLPLLNLTSWLCHLVLSPLVVLLSVLSGRLFIPEALQTPNAAGITCCNRFSSEISGLKLFFLLGAHRKTC